MKALVFLISTIILGVCIYIYMKQSEQTMLGIYIVDSDKDIIDYYHFKNNIVCHRSQQRLCIQRALNRDQFKHYFIINHEWESLAIVDPNFEPNDGTIYYVSQYTNETLNRKPMILPRIAFELCTFDDLYYFKECSPKIPRMETRHFYVNVTASKIQQDFLSPVRKVRLNEDTMGYGSFASVCRDYTTAFAMYRHAVQTKNETMFWKAYKCDPFRKEPLYYLARYVEKEKDWSTCLLYTRSGMGITEDLMHPDQIDIEFHIYDWAMEDLHAFCLYNAGKTIKAKEHWSKILARKSYINIPEKDLKRIKENTRI